MNTDSLYEAVLRDRYLLLPDAVQRFHRISGRRVLEGNVETDAPASPLARLLAACLGSPQRATKGAITFELATSPGAERWTRHFPTKTMQSDFRVVEGALEEKLGAARLTFKLHATKEALSMELQGMRFLGVPCPRWLLPKVTAEERGVGDFFHFLVSAELPFVGVVARYRGHLDLGSGDSP